MTRVGSIVLFALMLGASAKVLEATDDQFRIALFLEREIHSSEGAEVLRETIRAFSDSRRFIIVERNNLDAVTAEKALIELKGGDSGGVSALEDIDKIGFVSYVKRSPVIDGRRETHYVINVRLVDMRTALVEVTFDSERSVLDIDRENPLLDAVARESEEAGDLSDRIDQLDLASTPRAAARKLYENIRTLFPPIGRVLQISGDLALINLGARDGVKRGDLIEVLRPSDPIIDPSTGERFQGLQEVVGKLKAVDVQATATRCKVRSGKRAIAPGDSVRLLGSDRGLKGWVDRLKGGFSQ